ncbi:XdhC family protein [Thalassomonas sp. M1454]|uniref:XdhC family protein n=1 Tax=Thalassomonas sp. M1454 TaxID=2594477 RepID=UPI00117FBB59|nr:XdhC family protein [Thalassomonas sp. M1454]TRX56369.1 XdhC family protein [Thalassomonas sp. M1454]
MQLTDLEVIKQAQQWLKNGKDIWLCTILNTYGSAPRPIGSIFVTDGVTRSGSISGGCLEDAFIELIKVQRFTKPAEIFSYGDHANEQDIVKELPCGGTIQLLVEYIPANTNNSAHIDDLLALANEKLPFIREVNLLSPDKTVKHNSQESCAQVSISESLVTLAYAQVWTVLIIGIGQVSHHVAQLSLMSGFEVKICDMRKELSPTWKFDHRHGGIDITWQSPDLFVEQNATTRSAVLALAHDPKIDDVALMSVFDTQAFYIGAMGSKRTTNNRLERLSRICDLSANKLARLHAPIGLHIGSKTPMEIAISILADVIRVKNKVNKQDI